MSRQKLIDIIFKRELRMQFRPVMRGTYKSEHQVQLFQIV